MKHTFLPSYPIIILLFIQSCTGNINKEPGIPVTSDGTETKEEVELSYLALGKIDTALYEQGKELFYDKCAHCHQLDSKKTGPSLRNITKRHSAEWIMNKMESVIKFKAIIERKLKEGDSAKNFTPGRSQIPITSPEERRAVIEFLRQEGRTAQGKRGE